MQHDEDQRDERTRIRSRNQMIKATSSLYKLDPFLDNDGLVRIGGRLHKATMPFEEKHPVIIPKNSHITTLLIQHYHSKVQRHQGRGMTHNAIRQAGYWIILFSTSSPDVSSVVSFELLPPYKRCRTFQRNGSTQPLRSPTQEWTCSVHGLLKKVASNSNGGASFLPV